jgi:hypothetical protein
MPVPDSVGRQLKELDLAKVRNYPGRGGVPVGSHALGASTLARFKIVPDRGFDGIGSGLRLAVASQLVRLPAEEGSRPLLRLSEGETRQPIGMAHIVGRSKRIVMLAAILTAKAGDPCPAFCTFSVADRASRRNDRPVGLAPLR